LENEGASGG
jgi:hypothetical protein